MIKVEIKSTNKGAAELMVKMHAGLYHQDKKPTGMFAMDVSLTTVQNGLQADIKTIRRTNVHLAEFAYKVERANDETGQHLIVQHYTVQGDPDRIVAVIRDDEKPHNNWID